MSIPIYSIGWNASIFAGLPSSRILHSRRSFFESSSSVRSIIWLRFFWSPSSLLPLLMHAPMATGVEECPVAPASSGVCCCSPNRYVSWAGPRQRQWVAMSLEDGRGKDAVPLVDWRGGLLAELLCRCGMLQRTAHGFLCVATNLAPSSHVARELQRRQPLSRQQAGPMLAAGPR